MHDLGTLGGKLSSAAAINGLGQVAGSSSTASGESHAFFWANGVMQDLGTLGGGFGTAVGLNAHRQVVGASKTRSNAVHAALWTAAERPETPE